MRARGLPIVWESPGVDELCGSLWAVSPSGVPGCGGKRRGSGLADEGVAKKRREGRTSTCTYVLDRGGTQHPPEE